MMKIFSKLTENFGKRRSSNSAGEYLCWEFHSRFADAKYEGDTCPNCGLGLVEYEDSEVFDDEWNDMIDEEAERQR